MTKVTVTEAPIQQWDGCKVGWAIYRLKSDADRVARQAKKDAKKKVAIGYDFGYQSPGKVTKDSDGLGYLVCLP